MITYQTKINIIEPIERCAKLVSAQPAPSRFESDSVVCSSTNRNNRRTAWDAKDEIIGRRNCQDSGLTIQEYSELKELPYESAGKPRQFRDDDRMGGCGRCATAPRLCRSVLSSTRVTVPTHYYKVIFDLTPPRKMIGFILPNEGSNEPLAAFAVTVDAVEKATGLDFFSKVPEEEQDRLERTISVKAWKGL